MNRKIIVAAVAGALTAPGAALAQVTVSGKLGVQLSNMRISDALPARAALSKNSTFVNDNASIIRIAAREQLGGGLEAFGQYEFRPLTDGVGGAAAGTLPVGSQTGVSYVGLRSNAWGSIRAGTDVTWGGVGTGLSTNASQHYGSSGLLNYVNVGGTTVSFSSSRQQNVILYDTPNMGGLRATVGWSSAPLGFDNDMTTGNRKGQAWYLMPQYGAGNWKVGYAYGDIKSEVATGAITPINIKAHKLWGEMNLGGVEFGLTYARIDGDHGVTGVRLVDVNKWLVPIRYRAGNNTFGFVYGRNSDDDAQAGDQKATMLGLSYNYNFSRRTNVGLTWMRMTNSAGSALDLTSTTSNGYAAAGASAGLGEDQNMISLSLNHNF